FFHAWRSFRRPCKRSGRKCMVLRPKATRAKSTNTTADTSTTTECVETLLATSPFGPSNLALTTARSPDLTTFRLSLGLQYLSAIRNLEPQTTGPARSQEAV